MKNAAKNILPDYPALKRVSLNGGYFGDWSRMISKVSAKDILYKFNSEGALANYERVARGESKGHVGPPWYHGLICECIRGISDLLVHSYDKELDDELDRIIDLMKKAQDADPENYLNPYTTLECPNQRWGDNGGNILFQHETYNTGALAEAGVHHYIATGKTSVLEIAVKMCNYLADFVGDAPKHNVVGEHSISEESFIKLCYLFRENKELSDKLGARPEEYLRVARYFVDHKGDNATRYTTPKFLREYAQDHRPAREQREAIGHAVRATLFYTGMATLAMEDGDESLANACKTIWKDVVDTKLHINGSVGAHRHEERFGVQYALPNDAYLETCAGVGLAFWGSEMFKMMPVASIWETVESTVYNLMPASVSEDGVKYTYENPLESRGNYDRWNWHGCPCCPPMLLKLAGFLPRMIFAQNGENIWLNLYIDSILERDDSKITLKDNKITVNTDSDKVELTFRIRIPEWSRNFKLAVNGENCDFEREFGYAVVSKAFADGDTVEMIYDTPIIKYMAHPYVKADYNRVAIKHGPLLYCAESIDNGKYEVWEDLDFDISEDASLVLEENGNIIGKRANGESFTLIPYRHWNNRGANPMRIWFKQKGYITDPMNTEGWEGKLYRPYAEY